MKSGSSDPVGVGERFIYDVTVTNLSMDTVANGLMVTDTIDSNTSFVDISVSRVGPVGSPEKLS